MEFIEGFSLIFLSILMVSPIAYFNILTLETVIQVGSTFWFQLISVFGLTAIVMYFGEFFKWFDLKIGSLLTGMFDHWFERKITAPVTILSAKLIEPDPTIKIDRYKVGHITRVTSLEAWLTHHPIDYSFFWDYEIDSKQLEDALSRVLAKLPIIGGVWRKIDEETLGIDHSNPKIEYQVCTTDLIPSVNDNDFNKENWYGKYMNGINHKFPFPESEHVFKVSIIYYPNKTNTNTTENHTNTNTITMNNNNNNNNNNNKQCTLMAVGCSHALTDGEGFFTLMRGIASEMRGEEWDIPTFDRSKLFIKDCDLKQFKPDSEILGKHFEYSVKSVPWVSNAIWPSRRWTVKTWKFNKQQIAKLKQKALQGKCGEQLKQMRLSTNDVIVALFWKLRATLNRDYEFDHPVICSLALNTRKWIPKRFSQNYFGNGLAFILLHKTRKELIDADFSEACYFVRTAVSQIKQSDFEDDLHLYPYIIKRSLSGVDTLHRYHTRWAVGGHGFDNGRYLMDRDVLISNLTKLNTLECDLGKGNPSRVRFNFQDEASQMGYAFKLDNDLNEIEYFGAIPQDDVAFYNKYDITDASLDWNEVNKYYAKETKRWIKTYPDRRLPIFNVNALYDGRKDTKFWNW